MRRRSLAASTACRPTRSRCCFSPRAITFRSPFARCFPGSSTRCRRQGASASILRWTSTGRRGLDRTSNGWRPSTTTSTRGAPNPSMPQSGPIGPICRAAHCSRTSSESAQRLLALEGRRPIFHPDGTRPWGAGARQSVWHRVSGPDGEPRDRRRDREAALSAAQPVLAARSYAVRGRPRSLATSPQPLLPAMTSPATAAALCPFRIRARKSSRFPKSGPRAY